MLFLSLSLSFYLSREKCRKIGGSPRISFFPIFFVLELVSVFANFSLPAFDIFLGAFSFTFFAAASEVAEPGKRMCARRLTLECSFRRGAAEFELNWKNRNRNKNNFLFFILQQQQQQQLQLQKESEREYTSVIKSINSQVKSSQLELFFFHSLVLSFSFSRSFSLVSFCSAVPTVDSYSYSCFFSCSCSCSLSFSPHINFFVLCLLLACLPACQKSIVCLLSVSEVNVSECNFFCAAFSVFWELKRSSLSLCPWMKRTSDWMNEKERERGWMWTGEWWIDDVIEMKLVQSCDVLREMNREKGKNWF